jgi:hypothetical protein
MRMLGETDLELGNRIHKELEMQARASEPQLFGREARSFGDYGQLRKQKKAPHQEVFYIPISAAEAKGKKPQPPGTAYGLNETCLRSVNNCTGEQITEYIQKIGKHLEAGAISQENAEIVLDYAYAELNKRLNADSTK